MNLDFFNDLKNNIEKNSTKKFMNELSDFLNKSEIEEGLYQVIDFGNDSVFLKNTETNKIFEEKNLPEEIKNKISNDYVLKYENGQYFIDQTLTDKFMESMISIREFRTIKDTFLENSGIKEIPENEKFKIVTKDDDCTVLCYGENELKQIEVPNALIPFFANNNKVLKFNHESGKFETL